jgi:hypothetical protein
MSTKMFRKDAYVREAPGLADLRFTDPAVPSRSCCCPARPAVKVLMPPTTARRHPVDLWLCGHHYRASLAALLAVGASVEDLAMTADLPQADHVATPA